MKKNVSIHIAHLTSWARRSGLNNSTSSRLWTRLGVLALIGFCLFAVTPRQNAQSICDPVRTPGCPGNRQTKLIFLVDRSGSMGLRGQTFNSQIEGVVRTLRDPAIIPRDGSIEVGVIIFSEAPNVVRVGDKLLTKIDSFQAAENAAKAVEALKCGNLSSQVFPCPFGATRFESAVQAADSLVSQNGEVGAYRLLVMSTDGQTTDADSAAGACRVRAARNAATTLGIGFEFDAILMGLDPAVSPEFAANKARVDALVNAQDVQPPGCSPSGGTTGGGTTGGPGPTGNPGGVGVQLDPQEANNLPGATLVINGGSCNAPGASPTSADCERQIKEYVDNIRTIIRQSVPPLALVVNTTADTAPGAPVGNNSLSLRQAIEAANCRGGETTITFAAAIAGGTISPAVPLPAITAQGVTINGCTGNNCTPAVTIDGTNTNITQGEAHSDGILVRSNRTTIRGLRIIKFKRAGIGVDPICPRDVTVNNLIELNVFEGNTVAGVVVKDPNPETAQAIQHSTGNKISQNAITDSTTLIDLGANGPTANDQGDADEGPNTLLNFPDAINVVTGEGSTVNVTGQVNGPTAAGATVEIFAVTKFHVTDGKLIIDGVRFLAAATTDANGAFTATGLALSPTGIYTATVTDKAGNTSELISDTTVKPARPIAAATTPINFGNVNLGTPSTAMPIQISNTGNAPLLVTACTVVRCVTTDPDNTARFALTGCPTTAINPGSTATVNVVFTPNACGAVTACAQFATNDPAKPTITSTLNGTGTATGQGRIILEGGGSALDFGTVGAKGNGLKPKKQPKRSFTIENNGCQTLSVTIGNVVRTGTDTTNGKISNPNDNKFWSVVALSSSGVESPVSNPVTLAPRETRTFRVKFNPSIPAVSNQVTGLAASEVLPDTINSQVQITQVGGPPLPVNLIGRVTTDVKMINPANPANEAGVNFTRSGDEFTVEFSVFDSNLNVNRASYQFIDGRGRPVGELFTVDLTTEIQSRNLVRGQSFTITQKFTGARDNDNVTLVNVSVSDGEATVNASGNLIAAGAASLKSVKSERTQVVMPAKNLKKAANRNTGRQPDGDSAGKSGAAYKGTIGIESTGGISSYLLGFQLVLPTYPLPSAKWVSARRGVVFESIDGACMVSGERKEKLL